MSTNAGRSAEAAAAKFLQKRGYKIVAQNWRTRWCEIDIVTQKSDTIYFVEVKYRHNNLYGTGLEYITKRKLQQMHFAAEFWQAAHKQADADYRLAAVEVSGSDFTITSWLDDL